MLLQHTDTRESSLIWRHTNHSHGTYLNLT